jgi:uridine kinase
MTQRQVLRRLADLVVALDRPHPIRVAIDGIDAAGKTTLGDALAPLIRRRGRPVIRASVDGFHRPRADRYRRGAESPEGYLQDAFDYPALRAALLDPLDPAAICVTAELHLTSALMRRSPLRSRQRSPTPCS